MEKRDLSKSTAGSMRMSAVVAKKINLPKFKNIHRHASQNDLIQV